MIVTLDAFSGRPNPSWRLSTKDNLRLLERMSGKTLTAESESPDTSLLGPRGFVIDAASDDDVPSGAPLSFRVGAQAFSTQGVQARSGAFSIAESQEVSRFLLNTGRHVIEDDLMEFLDKSVARSAEPRISSIDLMQPAEPAPEEPEEQEEQPQVQSEMREAAVAAACIIANTAYNPGFWNTPAVQPKNNCYCVTQSTVLMW